MRRERGFTLVELMVVIVILGGLIALVGPNVFRALGQSNNGIARAQMDSFRQAIDQYKMTNHNLPDSLDVLTQKDERMSEPLMTSIPKDPWDKPYEYRRDGNKSFTLRSAGEDGMPDTPDDIVWPENDK